MLDLRKNVHPVEKLIEQGKITIEQVLEYAQNYMDACDQLDDEQIDKHTYNLEWESNDLDAPDYYDTQDVEWPTDTRSSYPEYIIASTSFAPGFEETYIFECDESGDIWDFAEYGGLAKRWGNENWKDYYAAVESVFGKDKYRYEKRVEVSKDRVVHHVFKRI